MDLQLTPAQYRVNLRDAPVLMLSTGDAGKRHIGWRRGRATHGQVGACIYTNRWRRSVAAYLKP